VASEEATSLFLSPEPQDGSDAVEAVLAKGRRERHAARPDAPSMPQVEPVAQGARRLPPDERPKRYSIEMLLATGVQPFDDPEPEVLVALTKHLHKGRPLPVKPVISADGILVDGHQRLRILLDKGRRSISADDVVVDQRITQENALEWALRLNACRRQLTVEEKAKAAYRLRIDRGWSQAKVADVFGVSRQAVGQWLGMLEDLSAPAQVEGQDGKMYASPKPKSKPKPTPADPHPWSEHGTYLREITRLRHRMSNPMCIAFEGLAPHEIDVVRDELEQMAAVIEDALASIGGSDDAR